MLDFLKNHWKFCLMLLFAVFISLSLCALFPLTSPILATVMTGLGGWTLLGHAPLAFLVPPFSTAGAFAGAVLTTAAIGTAATGLATLAFAALVDGVTAIVDRCRGVHKAPKKGDEPVVLEQHTKQTTAIVSDPLNTRSDSPAVIASSLNTSSATLTSENYHNNASRRFTESSDYEVRPLLAGKASAEEIHEIPLNDDSLDDFTQSAHTPTM